MTRSAVELQGDMESAAGELRTLARALEDHLAAADVDWRAVDDAYVDFRDVADDLDAMHDELPFPEGDA